ncbi:MAG: DUF2779 domain-containing protein [Clostridia bacterium]|nr:DUF2779 domain-containing protein [Clostridia bacterium]
MHTAYLTEAQYLSGLSCPKRLWFAYRDGACPEVSPSAGREQLLRAARLRMGGMREGNVAIAPEADAEERCFATERALANGARRVFGAALTCEGRLAEADALVRCAGGRIGVVYVCDGFRIPDSLTERAACFCVTLQTLGYTPAGVRVLRPDPNYVHGGTLVPEELLITEDITCRVQNRAGFAAQRLSEASDTVARRTPPGVDFGAHCFKPERCPYFGRCAEDAGLPSPNVFDLGGMQLTTKLRLYGEGKVSFEQLRTVKRLCATARMQLDAAEQGPETGIAVDREALAGFLGTLHYPLYHLDFETLNAPVPLYPGMRPYEFMPFQYSLHVQEAPGAEPGHTEYLAPLPDEREADPQREIAERLCREIPRDACVLAWCSGFEQGVLTGLGERYADLAPHLNAIAGNLTDLMLPFRKRMVVPAATHGSCSLKKVLPALFPDDPALDYGALEGVHNGAEAPDAFIRMALTAGEPRERIRRQLLEYCGLDTYAMVRILGKLTELAKGD